MSQEVLLTPEELENKEIIKRYRHLLRAAKRVTTKEDKRLIRDAFELSLEAHKEMRRKSGEPYIFHPLAVAQIAAEEIGLGATSIACALMHDVVEDTDVDLDFIRKKFGKQVASIIDGLTKISGVQFDEAWQQHVKLPLQNMQIPVIHYHHLIINKMCSNRLKDKADVEELQKINQHKSKP